MITTPNYRKSQVVGSIKAKDYKESHDHTIIQFSGYEDIEGPLTPVPGNGIFSLKKDGWIDGVIGWMLYPIPYEGYFNEMIVNIRENTCDHPVIINLVRYNPMNNCNVLRVIVPALTIGVFSAKGSKWKKDVDGVGLSPIYHRNDFVAILVDTRGSDAEQGIGVTAALSYRKLNLRPIRPI